DVLLGALCRLVDPLIRTRTQKQWEAIAAYRELGRMMSNDDRPLGGVRQGERDFRLGRADRSPMACQAVLCRSLAAGAAKARAA
ncbi:MAG: hypothetical protein ACOYN0_12340, partial [Phycisphaerales bacterium]